MAVIIAGKGAYDLSKVFKMYVIDDTDNYFLCICYPFLDDEKGAGWTECLPLNKDTDGEALLTYLVQAKESDVILVWEEVLKSFRKERKEEEGEVQRLKEEVERLRRENEGLREENKGLRLQIEALEDANAAEVAAADREIEEIMEGLSLIHISEPTRPY